MAPLFTGKRNPAGRSAARRGGVQWLSKAKCLVPGVQPGLLGGAAGSRVDGEVLDKRQRSRAPNRPRQSRPSATVPVGAKPRRHKERPRDMTACRMTAKRANCPAIMRVPGRRSGESSASETRADPEMRDSESRDKGERANEPKASEKVRGEHASGVTAFVSAANKTGATVDAPVPMPPEQSEGVRCRSRRRIPCVAGVRGEACAQRPTTTAAHPLDVVRGVPSPGWPQRCWQRGGALAARQGLPGVQPGRAGGPPCRPSSGTVPWLCRARIMTRRALRRAVQPNRGAMCGAGMGRIALAVRAAVTHTTAQVGAALERNSRGVHGLACADCEPLAGADSDAGGAGAARMRASSGARSARAASRRCAICCCGGARKPAACKPSLMMTSTPARIASASKTRAPMSTRTNANQRRSTFIFWPSARASRRDWRS